jgi:alkylhydroperoxidase family enzyme
MTKITDPFAAAPQVMKLWIAASQAAEASLERDLIELVKIRSSQINGCANCINMHTAPRPRWPGPTP